MTSTTHRLVPKTALAALVLAVVASLVLGGTCMTFAQLLNDERSSCEAALQLVVGTFPQP
jgi:hypothetical protein